MHQVANFGHRDDTPGILVPMVPTEHPEAKIFRREPGRRMDERHLQWLHRRGSSEKRVSRKTLAKVVKSTARNIRPSLENFAIT